MIETERGQWNEGFNADILYDVHPISETCQSLVIEAKKGKSGHEI